MTTTTTTATATTITNFSSMYMNTYIFGLLSEAIENGEPCATIKVKREFLTYDERYQIDDRTKRSVEYLRESFDDCKMFALQGVPHWETGKIYLTDGVGRLKVTKEIDPEKYDSFWVLVSLKPFFKEDGTVDEEARLKYEAEMYAYQNRDVAKLTPKQKHGAFKCIGGSAGKAAERLDYIANKHNLTVTENKKNLVGREISYTTLFNEVCKCAKANEFATFIFKFTEIARLDNGYSRMLIKGIKQLKSTGDFSDDVCFDLARKLRPYTSSQISAAAKMLHGKESTIYPMFEDYILNYREWAEIEAKLEEAKRIR